jgi:hypothetical protein
MTISSSRRISSTTARSLFAATLMTTLGMVVVAAPGLMTANADSHSNNNEGRVSCQSDENDNRGDDERRVRPDRVNAQGDNERERRENARGRQLPVAELRRARRHRVGELARVLAGRRASTESTPVTELARESTR